MKPIDVAVIRYYSESGGVYIPLNRILRARNTFGQNASIVEDFTPFEKYAETLVRALKKWMVHYPYKGTVYRKLSLPRGCNPYKPDLVGKTVEHHDFLSTLESGGMFHPPGKDGDEIIVIEIQNAKGVNIQMLSNLPYEKEILLLPNSKFKVISVDEKPNETIKVVLEMIEAIDDKLPPTCMLKTEQNRIVTTGHHTPSDLSMKDAETEHRTALSNKKSSKAPDMAKLPTSSNFGPVKSISRTGLTLSESGNATPENVDNEVDCSLVILAITSLTGFFVLANYLLG